MSQSAPLRTHSQTALLVAGLRARATKREEPICQDPWAAQLAGELGMSLAERHTQVYAAAELWLAVRTAWIDRRVEALVGGESRNQVVLLGAGLDTRAARLSRPGVRWFEVDHPTSQALKLSRLDGLDGYPREASTYVRCDFEDDDFLDRLCDAGFRAEHPALFLWEGVTPYLSEEAIRATAGRIAERCHGQTVLLFDHLEEKLVAGRSKEDSDQALVGLVEELGEPFRFGINDPLPLLVEAGFAQVRQTSFDEIALTLTGTYDRERLFRFQHVVEASREPVQTSW